MERCLRVRERQPRYWLGREPLVVVVQLGAEGSFDRGGAVDLANQGVEHLPEDFGAWAEAGSRQLVDQSDQRPSAPPTVVPLERPGACLADRGDGGPIGEGDRAFISVPVSSGAHR